MFLIDTEIKRLFIAPLFLLLPNYFTNQSVQISVVNG